MLNGKSTPGPWEVGFSNLSKQGISESCSSRRTIAFVHSRHFDDFLCEGIEQSEMNANARLIASAPDLLEACKEILNLLEAEMPIWYLRYHYNVLSSAIAKATGNTATHTTSSVIEA